MKTTVTRLPRGFSLVEVTLALGVAAFCLVALFGLLPIGVNSNQTTLEQTGAASIAAGVVADLRSTMVSGSTVPASSSPSPSSSPPLSRQYGIPVLPTTSSTTTNINGVTTSTPTFTLFLRDDGSMARDPAKTVTNTSTGWDLDQKWNPHYRVTLIFTPPAANQLGATTVRVLVTWPAVADPKAIAPAATDPLKDPNFPSKFSGSFEAVTALDRS